jgi:uncharacterized protein (DUF2236 family)
MFVTRREFDAELARARATVRDPSHGLFGPGSQMWRLSRDSVVFLGAGRAALLQLAHPYVAHAVDQHSETRRDPIGRFNRTFLNVYGIVFGDLETATASAQRVRGVHDGIHGVVDEDVGHVSRGHRYHAHDAGALLWVFATLIDTSVMAYELGFGTLSPEERDRYYQESKLFARLFGLSDAILPPDWPAFSAYVERMVSSGELAVGRPAREIAGFLLSPPSLPLWPASRWYRTLTAGMMPAPLREPFGLPFSRADALVYRQSIAAIRRGWPLLPARIRLRPEYIEAKRRVAGRPRPDRVGRAMHQALLKGIRPPATT